MKANWFTLYLLLTAYSNKYFTVLMEAVGDQVSPFKYLFWRSPLNTILNFNFSILPSYWIFLYKHSWVESQARPFLDHQLKKYDCWLKVLIFFRVAWSQGFLMSSDNLVASAKFRGPGKSKKLLILIHPKLVILVESY